HAAEEGREEEPQQRDAQPEDDLLKRHRVVPPSALSGEASMARVCGSSSETISDAIAAPRVDSTSMSTLPRRTMSPERARRPSLRSTRPATVSDSVSAFCPKASAQSWALRRP